MRFNARIDGWVKAVMIGIVIMYLPMLLIDEVMDSMLEILLSMAVTAVFILPLILNAHYDLMEEHLHVHLGYIRLNVKYEDIINVVEHDTWGASSSFSLSRFRVRITKSKGLIRQVDISPADRDEFVYQLKMLCRNLPEKEF